jgi:hypothetical protein
MSALNVEHVLLVVESCSYLASPQEATRRSHVCVLFYCRRLLGRPSMLMRLECAGDICACDQQKAMAERSRRMMLTRR